MDRDVAQSTRNAVRLETVLVPNPISVLASDRRDPFMSFVTPFKPIEHFLLDYCEFPLALLPEAIVTTSHDDRRPLCRQIPGTILVD